MITEITIAVVASVPGILMGVAALRRRKGNAAAMQELRDSLAGTRADLNQTRDDLKEARSNISDLVRRVDECDRERLALIRENLNLYRRLDDPKK